MKENILMRALELAYNIGGLIEIDDWKDPYLEKGRVHHRFIGAVMQELVASLAPMAIAIKEDNRKTNLFTEAEILKRITERE